MFAKANDCFATCETTSGANARIDKTVTGETITILEKDVDSAATSCCYRITFPGGKTGTWPTFQFKIANPSTTNIVRVFLGRIFLAPAADYSPHLPSIGFIWGAPHNFLPTFLVGV